MSKYIIELDGNAKEVVIISLEDGDMWTNTMEVDDLEQLNSDYINEHFSDLQDAAYKKGLHDGESKCRYCNEYQRGFEDGKAVNDKGCEGCMWEGNPYDVCEQCSNAYKNLWTAMQKTDEIKVGDEVRHERGWTAVVTNNQNGFLTCMDETGTFARYENIIGFSKTGRHFDIEEILDEMKRED